MILNFIAKYRRYFMLYALASACMVLCVLVTGCAAPTWLTDATNLIPVLVASATSILSFVAGLTGNTIAANVLTAITAWSTKVEAGLKNIETLVSEYNSNPNDTTLENIEAAAQLVVSDIGTFDSIIGIPDTVSSKLQSFAQLILTQLEAWLTLLPALKTAATVPGTSLTVTVPMTSKAFKIQHNALLATPTGHDETDAALAQAKKI